MNKIKTWIAKRNTDYDFKTVVSAAGSLAVTMVFAVYNGYLGIYYSSVWYGTICVYYIVLSLLRGLIVRHLHNRQEKSRAKVYIMASVLLMILNISLIVPVSLMVIQQKPVHMTLIPAITMAAYTTYKITMAAVNLKRRRKSSDNLIRLLRTINFIDALVSILTLQNTLIMVSAKGNLSEILPLTAITSGAIWAFILLWSVSTLVNGIRSIIRKQGD